MQTRKYHIGSIWGRKQIIEFAGYNDYAQPTYLWKCLDCDKVYGPRTGTDITRSEYARCCQFRHKKRSDYKGSGEITGRRVANWQHGAAKRGLEFSLTSDYLWNLFLAQGSKCVYSGLPLTIGQDESLDRVDSTQGYVEGNVQWVHRIVNIMKWDHSEKEFLGWCKRIVEHAGGNNG